MKKKGLQIQELIGKATQRRKNNFLQAGVVTCFSFPICNDYVSEPQTKRLQKREWKNIQKLREQKMKTKVN